MARMKHERTAEYATAADFCRIFAEDMKSLYLLSLLLTADPGKAEQCFVSGLNDCGDGNRVFREWARSWARRTIIQKAIRLIAPQPDARGISERDQDVAGDQVPQVLRAMVSAVLELGSFERFVLVMSVFEGYSDQECALLLGCTRQILMAAKVRALQHMTRSLEVNNANPADTGSNSETLQNNGSVIELAPPARLATPA